MFEEIVNKNLLGNQVIEYLISFAGIIAGIIVIYVIKFHILLKLKKIAEKTKTKLDDHILTAIKTKFMPLLFYMVFYMNIKPLIINVIFLKIINIVSIIFFTIFGVRFLLSVIIFSLETYWENKEEDSEKKQAIKGIISVVTLLIWSLAIIIMLDNLGIKISALVAGLGIGGIAIALASQAILGDLFSYFTIFFDRPFEIGDFIIINDFMGVVEYIGIKTTRVRSLGGEQLVFSNTDLTNSRVRNYKRMEKRRVLFKLGVVYNTKLEVLKNIPEIIKNSIEKIENTVFDRAHFFSYGDSSLLFEIVYYVLGSDYKLYMDIQQDINFKIKEEFEKRKIEFAFPTQTIYLNK